MMKTALVILALCVATPASAACYADYKAKQDSPLRLHYGVIELPDNACSAKAARQRISQRIARGGWSLLEVMSTFDESGLNTRRARAGEFFLKY